jgi:UDP-N-acetyl-D-glucosamine dehydrogenase
MPAEIVKRVKKENGGRLDGKNVLVCGIAYKPNISDFRETPSELLIEELEKEGAVINWHDPMVEVWRNSKSSELGSKKFDLTIVAMVHDVMDHTQILNSSAYILDCTGKIKGALQL